MTKPTPYLGQEPSGVNPTGAPVRSFNDAEFSASGLGGSDDLGHLAESAVEYINRRLAAGNLDFVEAYNEGWAYTVVPLTAKLTARKYDLIFCAVPNGIEPLESGRVAPVTDHNTCTGNPDRAEGGVRRLTKLVQGPQGVIPSFVWLEAAKQRHDLIRQIAAPALDNVVQPFRRVGNRKVRAFGPNLASGDRDGISGLVECRPQSEERLKGEIVATGGQAFDEFDYVVLVDSIGIRLYKQGVWLAKQEPFDLAVEIDEVLLCTQDSPFRMVERI